MYSGSLIQQNFGETIDGHGFVLWDYSNDTYKFIEIFNIYAFIYLDIVNGFIQNKTFVDKYINRHLTIKCKIYNSTISQVEDIKQSLIDQNFIIKKFITSASTTNYLTSNGNLDFERDKDINIEDEIDIIKKNISGDKFKDDIIELHKQLSLSLITKNSPNSSKWWNIISLEFSNIYIYGGDYINYINFVTGINNICSPNTTGKSSIVNIILIALFGKVSSNLDGSADIINKNKTHGYIQINFICNGTEMTVKRNFRSTVVKKIPTITSEISLFSVTNNICLNGISKDKTQDIICSYIGTFDSFIINNVISTKHHLNLRYMTSSQIIEYFHTVCNTLKYNEFVVEVKKLFSNVNDKFKTNIAQINILKTQITNDQPNISDSDSNSIDTFKNNITEIKTYIDNLNNEKFNISINIEKIKQKFNYSYESNISEQIIKDNIISYNYTKNELYNKLSTDIKNIINELTIDSAKVLINECKKNIPSDYKKYENSLHKYNSCKNIIDSHLESKGNIDHSLANFYTAKIFEINSKIESLEKTKSSKIYENYEIVDDLSISCLSEDKLIEYKNSLNIELARIPPFDSNVSTEFINNLQNERNICKNLIKTFINDDIDAKIFIEKKILSELESKLNSVQVYIQNDYNIDDLNKQKKNLLTVPEYITITENDLSLIDAYKEKLTDIDFNIIISDFKNYLNDHNVNIEISVENSIRIFSNIIDGLDFNKFLKIKENIFKNSERDKIIALNNNIIKDNDIIDKQINYIKRTEIINNINIVTDNIKNLECNKKFFCINDLIIKAENDIIYKNIYNDKNNKILNINKQLNNINIDKFKTISNEINRLNEELNSFNYYIKWIDQFNVLNKNLENSFNEYQLSLNIDLNLDKIKQYEVAIEIIGYNDKIKKYTDLLENIDDVNLISTLESKINDINSKIIDHQNKINILNYELELFKEKLTKNSIINENNEKINATIDKLTLDNLSLEKNINIYSEYIKLFDKNNIPLKILDIKLNKFISYTNDIFSKYTKYSFNIEKTDTNKLCLVVNEKNSMFKLNISKLSGYESVVLQVALNQASNKINANSSSGFLVIDEAFDCIDTNNFIHVLPQINIIIRKYYHNILLISHRDIPDDIIDAQIKIYHNTTKNFSKIL